MRERNRQNMALRRDLPRFFLGFLLGCGGFLAQAQPQPYIGFVYPAGGRQGMTVTCTLGGQALEGVCGVVVSGGGAEGRVLEYHKLLNSQEIRLLDEQLRELRMIKPRERDASTTNLIGRLEKIVDEYVQQPQCVSIANQTLVELRLAKDAALGPREIRLLTPRGISNPLVFMIGPLPEYAGGPLPTSPKQILGKEALSLRRHGKMTRQRRKNKGDAMMEMEITQMSTAMAGPDAQTDLDDEEMTIRLPCTVNGQIASGSVDRYRFTARKGLHLVAQVQARTLIPYLADAVPGWFQPVLVLCDAQGRELAYNDDFRFQPDPVLMAEIPKDGDYILAIHDAIFRGREDFVYRITLGELPFITSVFPLGGQVGVGAVVDVKGVNLIETQLVPDMRDRSAGVVALTARGKGGLRSNPVPFAADALPDGIEEEPNGLAKNAQRVSLPVIMNGTIGTPGDQDLFRFDGRAGQTVVAEVTARRLDSPLDAILRITDAQGCLLARNDDQEDLASGVNTHHADSYLRLTLPADGAYTVHLGDAQHNGGEAYAYRLRLSAPQPDFVLRTVPSHVEMRSRGSAPLTVYAIRRDGFTGPIHLRVHDPSDGFSVQDGVLTGTQTVARVTIRTTLQETENPVPLVIQGVATNAAGEAMIHDAVAAEDRMQAFLWRHLVPAQELLACVYPPSAGRSDSRKDRRLGKKK